MSSDAGYFYTNNPLGTQYGNPQLMQDPNAIMYHQSYITPQYGANPNHEYKQ